MLRRPPAEHGFALTPIYPRRVGVARLRCKWLPAPPALHRSESAAPCADLRMGGAWLAPRMNPQEIVRHQRVTDGAAIHGGCLFVRKRLVRGKVPPRAMGGAALRHAGQEAGALAGTERRAVGPQLAGRRSAPAVGRRQFVGQALRSLGIVTPRRAGPTVELGQGFLIAAQLAIRSFDAAVVLRMTLRSVDDVPSRDRLNDRCQKNAKFLVKKRSWEKSQETPD